MPRAFLTVLVLVGAAGCVTLSRSTPPTHEYRLYYPPPEKTGAEALPVVVHVARFHAAEPYAGAEIVYREENHRIGSYAYHRWASEPAGMVATLVARDLASSGGYRAVLRGPSPLRSDYEIDAEIEALEEHFGSPCAARVEIRALLLRAGGDDRVVFQRSYEASDPCAGEDAEDVVAAMSRALASVSEQLRRDVRSAIAADLAAGEGGAGRGVRDEGRAR